MCAFPPGIDSIPCTGYAAHSFNSHAANGTVKIGSQALDQCVLFLAQFHCITFV